MCNCISKQNSPVLVNTIRDGFVQCFQFVEAMLVDENNSQRSFAILPLNPTPLPCFDGKVIVYTFYTPDGKGAHALLPFPEDYDLFY